jgi:hypothetical protein
MNWHFLTHAVVGVGAILLSVAPFAGRTRHAPRHVRVLLLLMGPVGVAWSVIGIYLLYNSNEHGKTLLPWPQFWALDHIKANLAGLAIGILLCVFTNPDFYKRKRVDSANI